jgi:hypothetical protein
MDEDIIRTTGDSFEGGKERRGGKQHHAKFGFDLCIVSFIESVHSEFLE